MFWNKRIKLTDLIIIKKLNKETKLVNLEPIIRRS